MSPTQATPQSAVPPTPKSPTQATPKSPTQATPQSPTPGPKQTPKPKVPAAPAVPVPPPFGSTATLPLYGEVKLVTSLVFDIGVYLIVVGLVLDILRSLGAELDRQETAP